MYVTFGTRPYGTCDVIPELFYVGTWFFHINYIPLFPTQSNLVLGKQGNNYRVIRIPLSVKSIFLTWTRLGTFAALVAATISGFLAAGDDVGMIIAFSFAAFFALCFTFLMIFPRKKMPSYKRACKLAQLANLSDTAWAALNVLYGKDPFDRPTKPGEMIPVR